MGCTSTEVRPLGNGYEEVDLVTRSWEPESHHTTLQYVDRPHHRILVWQSTEPPDVNGDTCIFVSSADRSVFAVMEPGPVVRITGKIYEKWVKTKGISSQTTKNAEVLSVKKVGPALNVTIIYGLPMGDLTAEISLEWDEINQWIREAREKGTLQTYDTWGSERYKGLPSYMEMPPNF
jgi:hypothetical protein